MVTSYLHHTGQIFSCQHIKRMQYRENLRLVNLHAKHKLNPCLRSHSDISATRVEPPDDNGDFLYCWRLAPSPSQALGRKFLGN